MESDFIPNLLSWLLPIGLLIGFWWFVIRHMMAKQGGMDGLMSVGKSKARVYAEEDTGTAFDDVAGVEETKQELQETVLSHGPKLSFWRPPTNLRFWTRRCCVPAGSTAKSWWTGRTSAGAWLFLRCT